MEHRGFDQENADNNSNERANKKPKINTNILFKYSNSAKVPKYICHCALLWIIPNLKTVWKE